MRFFNRVYSKGLFIGSLAVMALLGSAVGAIAFDFDHLLAFLFNQDGRFLHHPQAILCCILIFGLSWWIIKLVHRLYRRMK